jgi:transposase
MSTSPATPCANCARLQGTIDSLQRQVEELQRQLAALQKNSSTSSKPPSSDIVKPPKPAPPPGQSRRRRGGQYGHPKHDRALLPLEQLSAPPTDYRLSCCPDCHGQLQPALIDPRRLQQFELPEVPLVALEYRSHASFCPVCGKVHFAPFPREVAAAGLLGPRLTTLVAYLKGFCHASFSTIRTFLRDFVGVTVSRSHLNTVIGKVSAALAGSYQELLQDLPGQSVLNVDETGHKQSGERMWTWCFRAHLYTLFKIDSHRSGDVLIEVLGSEFDGVIGCDFFSAYRRYMREFSARLQFCLAHLIRDVKYLQTVSDWRDQCFGLGMGMALRELFGVIHRREELPEQEFQQRMQAARQKVLSYGTTVLVGPEGAVLAKRLREYGEGYFRFITTPGVEPTNNSAEQAIRFVVLDRVVTQGTRSEKGNRWCERIWSVIATAAQQGRNVFDYLYESVLAHFQGNKGPSLLPQTN